MINFSRRQFFNMALSRVAGGYRLIEELINVMGSDNLILINAG